MRIVLISGKARSGKDVTAKIIKEYLLKAGKRVLIIHYADFLKEFCRINYGYRGIKDAADRYILQHVGTDIVRKNNPDTWVNIMVELLKGVRTEFDFVLIPDVRFENEIDVIKRNFDDVFCLDIVRDNFDNGLTTSQKLHPSEMGLPECDFDKIIYNDGDLLDLKKSVVDVVSRNII